MFFFVCFLLNICIFVCHSNGKIYRNWRNTTNKIFHLIAYNLITNFEMEWNFFFIYFNWFFIQISNRSMGLTYEELYVYLNEPRWKLFRRCAWMSFWILLIAIFTSSCIISIIESKRCPVNNTKSQLNTIVSTLTNDIVSKNNFTTWLTLIMGKWRRITMKGISSMETIRVHCAYCTHRRSKFSINCNSREIWMERGTGDGGKYDVVWAKIIQMHTQKLLSKWDNCFIIIFCCCCCRFIIVYIKRRPQ